MRLLPYGDRATLVELGSTTEAVAWAAALAADLPDGVEQVVPAACTVLVVCADGADLPTVRRALGDVAPDDTEVEEEDLETVDVEVVYDGEDLDDVAAHTGLSVAEVVAAHTGQTWQVAFGGFAPGFAYLIGSDERLHVPRREESRSSVPRGSVGLAGEYSGAYPTSSPGGWQLIGRTEAVLFDVERDPPALLRPGVRVRFVDAGGEPS